ncbi:MAG: hypothetical protein ABIT01_18845 [Thermoanaerobaculia bacterium]
MGLAAKSWLGPLARFGLFTRGLVYVLVGLLSARPHPDGPWWGCGGTDGGAPHHPGGPFRKVSAGRVRRVALGAGRYRAVD